MVSLAGWVLGVQLHQNSPVLMIGANMVCRTMPVSAPSTVSGILSQQSLQRTPDNARVPVFLLEDAICVDENHVLHPLFANRFVAGPVRLASIAHSLQLPDRRVT